MKFRIYEFILHAYETEKFDWGCVKDTLTINNSHFYKITWDSDIKDSWHSESELKKAEHFNYYH